MTWLTTWITECFQESGLDRFGEQRRLDQLQLKIIAGNRQQIPNARIVRRNIDGFVLSATLGVPENNDNDIFHPTRNPRTVMIDTSIFDHNPICLEVCEDWIVAFRDFWIGEEQRAAGAGAWE